MQPFCLGVSGDYACFTRPEMKVERVSYDVITPSAARAIFEAVLWKPEIRWHISKIEVLKPIRWINLRRNEVGSVLSVNNVKTAMKRGTGWLGLNIEDDRQQRAGLFLRDVAYRIHANFEVPAEQSAVKYAEMFRRRARKGQCFNQPYLGCREFSCRFTLIEPDTLASSCIDEDRELGWMLHDFDYSDAHLPQPRFFHASLKKGVIDVPPYDSPEVRG